MKNVLIAIDTDEERALSQAKEVANLFGEEFKAHLLHVFQENSEGATISNLVTARRVEDYLSNEGIEVILYERSGAPAPQIVNIAGDIDADLISIAGRKRSPTGKVLFGSVAQDVILSTSRSVLVCDTMSD